jgi:ADP-heptose:LPS heptosyltransferase
MGDTLVALPAFRLVRKAFPEAQITLLTNQPVSGKAAPMEWILQHTGLHNATMEYPASSRSLRPLLALRRAIRNERFDLLVYLAKPKGGILTSVRDSLFFRLCGIRKVIGIPFSTRRLRCHPLPGADRYQNDCERMLPGLKMLGTPDLAEPSWWNLQLTSAERAEASRCLQRHGIAPPFIAAGVGTKIQAKDWGESNWQLLLGRLAAAHPDLGLVMIGSGDERDRAQRLLGGWHGPKANLCGSLPPRVSGAVLEKAGFLICHDSGPMHLAASVGLPCVAIFSARHPPGEWFPHGNQHTIFYRRTPCMGCGLEVCIEEKKKCILSISVDDVLQAAEARIEKLI